MSTVLSAPQASGASMRTGPSIALGDVIWDRNQTGDTHPYLVTGKDQWSLTLQPLSSHEATHYTTAATIAPGDKTGSYAPWTGCTSYLVGQSQIGAGPIQLSQYQPTMAQGPDGRVYVTGYSNFLIKFRVVGGISADKRKEILGA